MQLIKATTWDQVEVATTKTMKCIRPDGGSSWELAKQTWDDFNGTDDVIYYIIAPNATAEPTGYLRLLKVAGLYVGARVSTYVVDFVTPYRYLPVKLAKAFHPLHAHALLVKSLTCEDSPFTEDWPRIRLCFSALDRYPYHYQAVCEADWLVVL